MAAAIPLITAAATVGSTVAGISRARSADKRADKSAKAQLKNEQTKQLSQQEAQRIDEKDERLNLGTRKRITSLRQGSEGGQSLFGSLSGAQATLG